MLKIPGVAAATLSRHSLRSLEQRLLIPHHGTVFQRAKSKSPQLAKTRLERKGFDVPKRSTGLVGQSKPKRTAPEVLEKRQARKLKKKEREAQKTTGQSAQDSQTRSESSGLRKTREAKEFTVPIRRVGGEIFGKHKLAEKGLDVDVPIRHFDPNSWKRPNLEDIRIHDFPRPNEPHFYVDTAPPSDEELRAARPFFAHAKPKFAFSCSHFAEFPKSDVPEFAFIGRSNVGKSSLLNALFYAQNEKELARVGTRAGLTKLMNVFLAGDIDGGTEIKRHNGKQRIERWIRRGRGIAIVDMPGYGFGSHDSQGEEIIKYLSLRTQLRRTFVLINGEHGPTNLDTDMFKILAQAGISYQIVLTKTDKFLSPGNDPASVTQIRSGFELLQQTKSQLDELVKPPLRDVLCVSAAKSLNHRGRSKYDLIGMNALRLAILQGASMDRVKPPQVSVVIEEAPVKSRSQTERFKPPNEKRGKKFEDEYLREHIRKRRLEVIKQRLQDYQTMQEREKAEEGQSQ